MEWWKWKRKHQHYGMRHFAVDGILKKLFPALPLRVKNGTPLPSHWTAHGPLVLQPLITGGSSQRSSDERTGHKKDVPPINQTTGVTAHKIDELSLGVQHWWLPLVSASHTTHFVFVGGSQTDALPGILALPLVCSLPGPGGRTLLWTVSRVSYWCNWKCFVIAFHQTLMDVKLNEVWVLVIRAGLCEIYHPRLKRLRGTIKAAAPST